MSDGGLTALKQHLVTADGMGVGYEDSAAAAAALSERLTALGEWMEGAPPDAAEPDSAYACWKAWRQIARPGQLPPLTRWDAWSITGPSCSGKTTAAAQYIASVIEEPDIHLYVVGRTMQIAAHCFNMVRDISGTGKWHDAMLPRRGRLFSLEGNALRRVIVVGRPIVWIDESLEAGMNLELGSFLSRARARPNCRIIWSG